MPEGPHGWREPLVAASNELRVDLECCGIPAERNQRAFMQLVRNHHFRQHGDAHAGESTLLDGLDTGEGKCPAGTNACSAQRTLKDATIAAGLFRYQKLVGDNLRSRGATLERERMFPRNNGADGFDLQYVGDKLRVDDTFRDADAHIDTVVNGRPILLDAGCIEREFDTRIGRLEAAQELRQAIGENAFASTDAERPDGFAMHVRGLACFVGECEEAFGMREKAVANAGEFKRSWKAIEQRRTKLALKLLHLRGDAGLRVVQGGSGAGEAAFPRNGDEGTDLDKIKQSKSPMPAIVMIRWTRWRMSAILRA